MWLFGLQRNQPMEHCIWLNSQTPIQELASRFCCVCKGYRDGWHPEPRNPQSTSHLQKQSGWLGLAGQARGPCRHIAPSIQLGLGLKSSLGLLVRHAEGAIQEPTLHL